MPLRTLATLLLLALLVLSTAAHAELTEQDILEKEVAWARHSLRHYQHGFGAEKQLSTMEELTAADLNNVLLSASSEPVATISSSATTERSLLRGAIR